MNFIYFFDLLGTTAFAISGSLLGVKKDMDIYGLFILSLAVAVGGGTVRDVMLGNRPFVLTDPNYIYCTIGAVLLVAFFNRGVERGIQYLVIADSIGLGVFTVIGATKAIGSGLSWYAVVFLATLTSTGGGMIRDVLAGEIPFVLKKEVYASASIAGALIFFAANRLGLHENVNIVVTSFAVFTIRMMALKNNLNLPTLKRRDA